MGGRGGTASFGFTLSHSADMTDRAPATSRFHCWRKRRGARRCGMSAAGLSRY